MKLKDLFEGDVVQFPSRRAADPEPDYSDASFDDEVAADILASMERGEQKRSSPDVFDNEMDKRRFEKMLNNKSGEHIEAVDLVPYLREYIPDRKEFKEFTNRLLTGHEHLYTIVKYVNNILSKAGVPQRVVGVSQDGEDWYISK